jgi:hypothetical protein
MFNELNEKNEQDEIKKIIAKMRPRIIGPIFHFIAKCYEKLDQARQLRIERKALKLIW